jgi:amino acid adenylation domain-containing protein
MDWFTAISTDPSIGNPAVPSILINWLGRFDSSFEPNSAFEPLGIDVGPTTHPSNPRTSLLELVGLIDQGELRISLSADPLFINQAQFDILIQRINKSLDVLINAPLKIAHASWIPSDIPWLGSNDSNQFHNFIEQAGNFEKILPTTPVQQGLAYRHELEGESSGKYIQQIEFNIEGDLNPEHIANAFNEVANIHESLRTAIIQSEDGSYAQIVYPSTQMQHLIYDFSHVADPATKWTETVTNDRKLGFQIQKAPLSRTTIVKIAANQWKLLWTHHHLILDGWSVPIVINDLGKKLVGAEITTPASRSIFWDWLTRQKTLISAQEKSAIWRQRFENIQGPCLVAQLPHTQNQSTQEVTNVSEVLEWTMPLPLTNNIRSFLKRNGLTLSAFINAAWSYTLANLLDRDDAVHGVTISGRPSELQGSELWVGMFINTLPLYVNCKTDQSVASWLKEIQENLADLNTAPQDSLSDIQMWTNQSKPLFDSIVVFQNYPIQKNIVEHSDSLKITAAETIEKNEYPLSLYVDDKETIALTLRYDRQKISSNLVQIILEAIISSTNYWSKNENKNICTTNLTESTSKLNLLKWGSGAKELNFVTPADSIYQQAALDPKRIALQEESSLKSITYGDLVASSLKISARIKHQDFGYEDRICVLGHHRINTVIGMLGVQYAGAAFIPLDPNFPAARLNAIIEDATPSLILVEKTCLDHPALLNRPHISIEEILEDKNHIDFYEPELKVPEMALAYILFTSGSTGRPKGVQISNRAFSNALTYFVKFPGIYEGDQLASVTTISFDISLLEIFGPLTVGACVHLVSKETAKDGNDLKKYLEDHYINIMQATPSTWKILQAVQTKLPKLRAWCGGETFPRDLALWMKDSFQEVWNLYGPTETTIWSSTCKLSSQEITAGKPIANTEFIILSKNGDMTLPGAIGELCIAGKGISRGYIAKPGLTAQSFIPNQFSTGETLYRTGDQAYWTEEGNIVILGRLDKQIKINGFRIELGEIESAIRSLDSIKDAVALVVSHLSAPILVAWVIKQDKSSVREKAILDHIASKLPNYMVPRHIIFVDEIPLTANGKVNSNALSLPNSLGNANKRIAKDELEKVVLSILINTLSSSEMGPDDHFMEYGGNSLSATIIRGRLERLFKMNLPLGSIFELGSAAQIKELILQKENQKGVALETAKAFIKLSIAKKEQKAAIKNHGLNK